MATEQPRQQNEFVVFFVQLMDTKKPLDRESAISNTSEYHRCKVNACSEFNNVVSDCWLVPATAEGSALQGSTVCAGWPVMLEALRGATNVDAVLATHQLFYSNMCSISEKHAPDGFAPSTVAMRRFDPS